MFSQTKAAAAPKAEKPAKESPAKKEKPVKESPPKKEVDKAENGAKKGRGRPPKREAPAATAPKSGKGKCSRSLRSVKNVSLNQF